MALKTVTCVGDPDKIRVQRRWGWLIPTSRCYECDACGHQFLSLQFAHDHSIITTYTYLIKYFRVRL